MKSRLSIATLTFTACLILGTVFQNAHAFDRSEWSVRCWDFNENNWADVGLDKVTIAEHDGVTKVANTSGIHKHAHFVFPAELKGDFIFTIELKGGYELGFLNRAGKDEMLYLELNETDTEAFQTFELSREGSRISIKRNGRAMPLVHFKIDYGEDFLISLAIKDGESAEIRSYSLETNE